MSDAKPGIFPKFTDINDDWKLLTKEGETKIYYRIAERTNKKIDVTIKAKDRAIAVGRNIRSLLSDNQNQFGISGAGVTVYGGPLPLYGKDADGGATDEIIGYTQTYRYTLNPFA